MSHDVSEKDEVLRRENDKKMLEGTIFPVQAGTSPDVGTHDSNEESLIECTQNVVHSSRKNGKWPENVDNVRFDTSAVEDRCSPQIRDPSFVARDANFTSRHVKSSEDDPSMMVNVATVVCNRFQEQMCKTKRFLQLPITGRFLKAKNSRPVLQVSIFA